MWNADYQWDFPLAGSGDDVGFNETGIGMFKSQPYPSLAKEIIQNVLDARGTSVSDDEPVKVTFTSMEIDKDDIPGAEQLADTIDACCKYYPTGDNHDKIMQVKKYSDEHLRQNSKIPVLKISDFNTTGLTGVEKLDDKESCWYGLVKSFSSTNKSDGSSGSQGVGKFATYTFTKLRTVLYSTYTEDGHRGFQGKTILITFRDEQGQKRVNKARFGKPVQEDVLPITTESELPEVYHRDKPGTDIYIVGFEKDDDWLQQMAMSVIEFFFYAIYKGTLEVDLQDDADNIHIDKSNLGKQIDEYDEYYNNSDYVNDENFQYTVPIYWKAITDDSKNSYHVCDTFKYNNKPMGNYELYLLMGPDVSDRRILEMRKAGMKIREDTKFRIPPTFSGIFIATGEGAKSLSPDDNISSFLRMCENPSHDAWSAANYSEQKTKAKGIINRIHTIITDFIKSKMPEATEDEVKAYGINELLISQGEGNEENEKDDAFLLANPKPVEIGLGTAGSTKTKDLSRKSNGRGKNTSGKKKKKTQTGQKRNNKHGNKKKSVAPVTLESVKTPFDESRGVYRLIFTSPVDVKNLHLSIDSVGDDGNSESADITEALMDGTKLGFQDDCIVVPEVKGNEKNVIEISLRGNRRDRLEVSAYGES